MSILREIVFNVLICDRRKSYDFNIEVEEALTKNSPKKDSPSGEIDCVETENEV